MPPSFAGAVKSRTVWAAVVLGILAEVKPLWDALLPTLGLEPKTVAIVGFTFAVVMVACRAITTQSLNDKGSAPVLPPPESQK